MNLFNRILLMSFVSRCAILVSSHRSSPINCSSYLCSEIYFVQEVTPYVYDIFRVSSWCDMYNHCSVSCEEAKTRKHFCMMVRYYASFTSLGWPT